MKAQIDTRPPQIVTQPPGVGEPAPDFILDSPEGGKLQLGDLTNRPLLIIFQRHLG